MRPESGFRITENLAMNLKNDSDAAIFRHEVTVNFFDAVLFLLSSLVTVPSFMSISSLVLELWQFSFIRNPEIRNIPVLVFPNIWRLGQVKDTKFGTNVSNKILQNATKCRGKINCYHWFCQKFKDFITAAWCEVFAKTGREYSLKW